MADVKIEGLAELERDLQQFVDKLQRNVVRASLRAGAKVFLEEARRQVPVGKTGALRRSLKIRRRPKKPRGKTHPRPSNHGRHGSHQATNRNRAARVSRMRGWSARCRCSQSRSGSCPAIPSAACG